MFRLFGRESDKRDDSGQAPAQAGRTVVPAGTAAASPKDKQRTARPKTWLFRGYELVREPRTGFWCVYENRDRLNETTGLYEPNEHPIRTMIIVPEVCMSELEAGSSAKTEEIICHCESARRRLDQAGGDGGLKLLFDRRYGRDGQQAGWQPKWKYQSEPFATAGADDPFARRLRRASERILLIARDDWGVAARRVEDPDILPKNLYQLACDHWDRRAAGQFSPEYWKTPLWRDWFGKAIQRKRESIISEELARRYAAAAETAVTAAGDADGQLAHQALDAARNLLPLFRHIYRLPGERESLVKHLSASVAAVVAELGAQAGGEDPVTVVKAAVETIVAGSDGAEGGVAGVPLERAADGTIVASLAVQVRRLVAEALIVRPVGASVLPAAPTPSDVVDRIADGVTNSILAVRKLDALELDEPGCRLIVRDWGRFCRAIGNTRRRIAGF